MKYDYITEEFLNEKKIDKRILDYSGIELRYTIMQEIKKAYLKNGHENMHSFTEDDLRELLQKNVIINEKGEVLLFGSYDLNGYVSQYCYQYVLDEKENLNFTEYSAVPKAILEGESRIFSVDFYEIMHQYDSFGVEQQKKIKNTSKTSLTLASANEIAKKYLMDSKSNQNEMLFIRNHDVLSAHVGIKIPYSSEYCWGNVLLKGEDISLLIPSIDANRALESASYCSNKNDLVSFIENNDALHFSLTDKTELEKEQYFLWLHESLQNLDVYKRKGLENMLSKSEFVLETKRGI